MKVAVVRPSKEAHLAAREHLEAAREYVSTMATLGTDDEDLTALALSENRLLLAIVALAPFVALKEEG